MSTREFLLDWIPLVLTTALSVWAIFSSRRSARLDRQVQKLLASVAQSQERDRIAESRRAALTAYSEPSGSCTRLYLENDGAATARAIEVLVNGQPLQTDRLLARGETVPETIGSHATSSVLLMTLESSPLSVRLVVTWEDDSGERGLWETDLPLLRD